MLIGRERERARLREAIAERRSLLVYGPAGSGKSALLHDVLSSVGACLCRRCIVCAAEGAPSNIWLRLVTALAESGDSEVLTRAENDAASAEHFENWARAQTSLRLRGVIRRATRTRDYSIFLDAIAPLPDGVYRLLQEWVWSARTPVILLGRGSTQVELGKASQLYWHEGLRLYLGPLERASAEALLEDKIERFHLAKFADAQFRNFVLERSEGLPGKIGLLCKLASNTAYHCGGHVKLHTLAVDFLLQQELQTDWAARHA